MVENPTPAPQSNVAENTRSKEKKAEKRRKNLLEAKILADEIELAKRKKQKNKVDSINPANEKEEKLMAAGFSDADLLRYRRIAPRTERILVRADSMNERAFMNRIQATLLQADRFQDIRSRFASLEEFQTWTQRMRSTTRVNVGTPAAYRDATYTLWNGEDSHPGLLVARELRRRVMADNTLRPVHNPWKIPNRVTVPRDGVAATSGESRPEGASQPRVAQKPDKPSAAALEGAQPEYVSNPAAEGGAVPHGPEWEKLKKEYDRANAVEDVAIAEAEAAWKKVNTYTGDKNTEAYKKLHDAYRDARTKRENLARDRHAIARRLVPDLERRVAEMRREDARMAATGAHPLGAVEGGGTHHAAHGGAHPEAAPHAAPTAHQSAGFQGRDGQPARTVEGGGEAVPHLAATPADHRVSTSALRTGQDANWAARFAAGKNGNIDSAEVQRMISAPRRWARSIAEVVARMGLGVGVGISGLMPAIIPAAWQSLSIPVFGAFGIASLPVSVTLVAALGTGALAWSGIRRLMQMHRYDKYAEAGWEARKLMNKARYGDTPEDIERKYNKINKWYKKMFRAQTFIPNLLGGILAGGLISEAHAVRVNNSSATAGQALDRVTGRVESTGRSMWQWISERWSNLWSSGPPVPRCGVADHASARAALLEDYRVRTLMEEGRQVPQFPPQYPSSAEFPGQPYSVIDDLEDATRGDAMHDAQIVQGMRAAEMHIPSALEDAQRGTAMQDAEVFPEDRGILDASPARPTTPPAPQANPDVDGPSLAPEPQPQQAPPQQPPQAPTVDAEMLAQMARSREIFHIPSGPGGVWSAAEGMWQREGFDGRALTWLTDMVEDYTQDGSVAGTRRSSYFVDNLLERMTGRNGVMQTTIPANTVLRMEELFGERAIYDDMVRRISQAPYSELSPFQKNKAMRLLADWLSSSQQLLRIRS